VVHFGDAEVNRAFLDGDSLMNDRHVPGSPKGQPARAFSGYNAPKIALMIAVTIASITGVMIGPMK
jgi:hypothetical protein